MHTICTVGRYFRCARSWFQHTQFENKEKFEKPGWPTIVGINIGQTRGWFYLGVYVMATVLPQLDVARRSRT